MRSRRWKAGLWAILLASIMSGSVPAGTLEGLSRSVIYLLSPDGKYGTGFIATSARSYLVTAAHVAASLTPDSTVTFWNEGDIPVTLKLGDLSPGSSNLRWYIHPEADAAVLPISITATNKSLLLAVSLPLTMIESEAKAPDRARPLIIMGFPLKLGTTGRFSPITDEAKPASGMLRLARYDTRKPATFFLLDNPAIAGYSGAPVFLVSNSSVADGELVVPRVRGTTVLGLVHGTIGDETGARFTAIVPSCFILETLKIADRDAVPGQ